LITISAWATVKENKITIIELDIASFLGIVSPPKKIPGPPKYYGGLGGLFPVCLSAGRRPINKKALKRLSAAAGKLQGLNKKT
jgi:hypothetical protein